MRKIKFVILVFGLLVAQCVSAVRLPQGPSGAYSPAMNDDGYSESFSSPYGTTFTGTFSALGEGSYDKCKPGSIKGRTTSGAACEDCCADNYGDEDDMTPCINYCYGDSQPLSPIDGGWWFLIVLAVLGAAFSVTLRKKLI